MESKHHKELKRIKDEVGKGEFRKLIESLERVEFKETQARCRHVWRYSQIAGDPMFCAFCNKTKLEED